MLYEDDDLYSHRDGHWRVLPRWVKGVTIAIGLPAWLVLLASLFLGGIGSRYQMAAFAVFLGVAVLQIIFFLKAYWRMEL